MPAWHATSHPIALQIPATARVIVAFCASMDGGLTHPSGTGNLLSPPERRPGSHLQRIHGLQIHGLQPCQLQRAHLMHDEAAFTRLGVGDVHGRRPAARLQ